MIHQQWIAIGAAALLATTPCALAAVLEARVVVAPPVTPWLHCEDVGEPPDKWTVSDHPVAPSKPITLNFLLRPNQIDDFEKEVLRISTPNNSKYGKFLQTKDIVAWLSQPPNAVNSLINSLLNRNYTVEKTSYDVITVKTTIGEAEKLLSAKYRWYVHTSGQTRLRTLKFCLPKWLDNGTYFATVQPTTSFGLTKIQPIDVDSSSRKKLKRAGDIERGIVKPLEKRKDWFLSDPAIDNCTCHTSSVSDCAAPRCIARHYGFENFSAPANNTFIGIAGYLGQHAKYSDLELFMNQYVPEKAGNQSNFTTFNYHYGTNPQYPEPEDSDEANLDIQYTVAVTSPLLNVFYSIGESPNETVSENPNYFSNDTIDVSNDDPDLFQLLQYLIRAPQDKLPSVVSTSYGATEQGWPLDYAKHMCYMFAAIAARGVSMLYSSGDEGPGQWCVQKPSMRIGFVPDFPSGCPWITSVGATQGIDPEEAAEFSSGGFSNVWPIPSYQKCAVEHYLNSHGEAWGRFNNLFNQTGRAFPDVSALGTRFAVINNGTMRKESGTSASCPLFAGIILLLNSERISRGQPVLGFLNPWLYSQNVRDNNGLTDITHGTSLGCNMCEVAAEANISTTTLKAFGEIGNAGWRAVEGWDPSTGLGVPNFQGLLNSL